MKNEITQQEIYYKLTINFTEKVNSKKVFEGVFSNLIVSNLKALLQLTAFGSFTLQAQCYFSISKPIA
jgi:hypothetical protein